MLQSILSVIDCYALIKLNLHCRHHILASYSITNGFLCLLTLYSKICLLSIIFIVVFVHL